MASFLMIPDLITWGGPGGGGSKAGAGGCGARAADAALVAVRPLCSVQGREQEEKGPNCPTPSPSCPVVPSWSNGSVPEQGEVSASVLGGLAMLLGAMPSAGGGGACPGTLARRSQE